ncbi:hypothetical protein Pmar_PMAR019750 [Perkinsus marinus ATCC 50983]|uniref:Uncharacterized protein n=1 Tax=Perkinsus marinus (strain ATCC 50983 / TXsc) TaxID=423536 RepID=C5LW32_PERM5|nr:hypothetical protein Pmar_PMAR019750 [Perkinsus marinus ATCC 50983]EEQ99102.1 hypothetical protein Pmar_PMAR019750 [Perkinsus marinus ATCC 50983]|eukprot:XP_002766385.1 hypothetical protein Pmar_PMAR019750 [Perkinsus marinus ATCC 50983]
MPRKFEVKATPRSDTATTATTCTSFMNLLATGAYDGDDGIALPKHSVAFRIVSNRVIEGHDSGRVKVPVSGREVPLTKCEFEISVTGKVMKDAHAVWDGCEWSPADFTADEDYCNVNGDAESAVELQFDQGIVMLEYASVLQVLNRIAFVHHVLDKAGDIGPQLNTAIALLEALSLGKCRSFPIYYNGPYLARLHVAARHVVHDGPWARRLSNELRARCACLLACNLRQIVPDDSRCPCTVDGMIDQVGRSTRGLSSGDLTVNERRLLDIVERPF